MDRILRADDRLVRAPDALASEVDGEIVMMSVERGEYFSLTGVASRLWELIAEPTTIAHLTATIAAEYRVAPEVCEPDILAFAADMMAAGLAKAA
jgi:hypothetical protein